MALLDGWKHIFTLHIHNAYMDQTTQHTLSGICNNGPVSSLSKGVQILFNNSALQ